jgi:uncharacterized membrane protein YgcG
MKKYLLFFGVFVAGLAFAADPITVLDVPKKDAQAMTKQDDAIKIPSNAHSNAAAELGITFEWNTKQKDDCVLTVETLEDGTFYSFTLLIQSSGEYTMANITSPGVYEVAKGKHNINMVYVVDATPVTPKDKVCKAGKCRKNSHRKHKKNTDEDDDDQGEDDDDQGEDDDDQGEDDDDQGEDNDDQGGNGGGKGGACDIEDEDGNFDEGCQGDQGNKGGGSKGGGGNSQ